MKRISDTPAQGSEARPGVGGAVESKAADEKGLASRVEELEEALAEANTLLWSQGIDGVYPDALKQARSK